MNKTLNCRFIFLIVSYFLTLNCFSQNQLALIGKWNCERMETEDGDNGTGVTFSGAPFNCRLSLYFLESQKVFYSIENGESFELEYQYIEELLYIGNKIYKVEYLNATDLILLETSVSEISPMLLRYYFKKVIS